MRLKVAIFTGVALILASVPLLAHHAFAAEFDVNKPLKLTGTLKKWEMINPHSWFHIEIKKPDGKIEQWMIEGGSPSALIREGVTKETVPIGTTLIIDAYHAKSGDNKAVGRDFTLPDGKRLFLGGSAQNIDGKSDNK
jgi:hypothetical protein